MAGKFPKRKGTPKTDLTAFAITGCAGASALLKTAGGESGTERTPQVYPGSYVEYVQKIGHEAPGDL